MSKSAIVVGVAASAATVSGGVFSNTPSQHELPNATPIVSTTPSTQASSRPASSPSSLGEPKKSEVPAAQVPAVSTPPASPKNEVAGSLPHGEVPGVIKECVEKYLALREAGDSATNGERESTGAVCKAALAVSGLSGADFWAKFGPDAHKTEPKVVTPSTTLSTEVEHWIKECVTKYTRHTSDATATCKKAIELTGLTSGQFAEKYLGFDPKPTTAIKPQTAEFEQLVYTCRKLQGAISEASPTAPVTGAKEVCDKAIAASGLSAADFWKKWPAIKPTTGLPTTTPAPTVKPVTNTAELAQLVAKCLDLYKTITSTGGDTRAASDACRIAIQASGMSSADFWTKFHPTTATN